MYVTDMDLVSGDTVRVDDQARESHDYLRHDAGRAEPRSRVSTRVDRRIETQRSRLRDESSSARTALGELAVAVRVLRSAVSSLDQAHRDRLVLRVVTATREVINEAHEHQRRAARRRTHTQRRRIP